MNCVSRVSRQHPSEKEDLEEKKKDTDNGDVNDSMKQKYRNATAILAASAWGDDNGHRQNSPGSFRNMGKLGHPSPDAAASALNHVKFSSSAFEPVQLSQNELSIPDRHAQETGNNYGEIDEMTSESGKVPQAGLSNQDFHPQEISHSNNHKYTNKIKIKTDSHANKSNILKAMIFSVEKTYGRIKMADINKKIENDIAAYSISENSMHEHEEAGNDSAKEPDSPSRPTAPSGLRLALAASLDKDKDSRLSNAYPLKRGKCLSSPSEPISNNGLDNVEGNLIVYTNDILSVPKSTIHYQSTEKETKFNKSFTSDNGLVKFQVLELLGQGTFAQVFKCKNIQTNELMALKIVKSKPAYTRQAGIEIDIFKSLSTDLPVNFVREQQQRHNRRRQNGDNSNDSGESNMVELLSYFMHQKHLCLAFELLGLNLYEVLKIRQFRGLSIRVVQSFVRQAMKGVKKLSMHNIVHCDLKPENILLTDKDQLSSLSDNGEFLDVENNEATSENENNKPSPSETSRSHMPKIKLIDFGSACFEGQTAHTYIQSRFYRSPEVLVGLPYDSAIDMWSLGCVAAELFLGLPILPGAHEYDQLCRICEMIAPLPDWMVEQGSKSEKHFEKLHSRQPTHNEKSQGGVHGYRSSQKTTTNWRLKTRQEYLTYLSEKERGKYEKLDQQPNRYFKRKRLADIVSLHGHYLQGQDKQLLRVFNHFLKGILDPDPWKRWTAHQASQHPFVTGDIQEAQLRNKEFVWLAPWDPSICNRKLLRVDKAREKKALLRHEKVSRNSGLSSSIKSKQVIHSHALEPPPMTQIIHNSEILTEVPSQPTLSTEVNAAHRLSSMTKSMSLSHSFSSHAMPRSGFHHSFSGREGSPPPLLGLPNAPPPVFNHQYHQPPSNPGSYTLHSHMPGSLNGAIYPHDGRVYLQPPGPPNYPNAAPLNNSMIETQYPPAMMMAPNLQSYQVSHIPPMTGPQSFSGLYYDRISQHLPIEGDLGYALQRPGVVPSMETDQHGSHTQHHGMTYLPHHPQAPNDNHSNTRTRSTSFSCSSTNGNNIMQPSSSLHASFTGDFRTPRELQNDFNENNFQGDASIDESNSNGNSSSLLSSGSQGGSLLAQQLAEHSAMQDPKELSDRNQSQLSSSQSNIQLDQSATNHHLQPNYYPQQSNPYLKAGSHSSLMQQPQTQPGSYYGYAPTNQPPFILSSTAPTNADPNMASYYPNIAQYTGSHGSFYNNVHVSKHPDISGHPPMFSQTSHIADSSYQNVEDRNMPQNTLSHTQYELNR